MASIDRQSIEERGISGLYLMERAGEGITNGLLNRYTLQELYRSAIFCGKGNNGGDGFVVARRLSEAKLQPLVILIGSGEELKGEARTNYVLIREKGVPIRECHTSSDLERSLSEVADSHVFLDALLGTGVRGAPRGLIGEAVSALNRYAGRKRLISVDIPSGVDADTGKVEGEAVWADEVITMGLPKVGQVVPPGLDYCKNLFVLDIGFPTDLIENAVSEAELLTERLISSWLPVRTQSAHKGSEGHVLILAGSRGMTGAALMCAKSAVLTGAGLVTAVCPKSLLPIYASSVWEMLTLPVEETEEGSFTEKAWDTISNSNIRYSGIVIGPGIGRHPSAAALVRRIVRETEKPLLIDGDGLFAVTPDLLHERQFPWIATPHPGEMARLYQVSVPDVQADRWGYAKRLAGKENGTVVLKGAKSVIAHHRSGVYVNPTGNPAMATGGMGDVLAGMMSTFMAKGMECHRAATLGTYLHGYAADLLVNEMGVEALGATQVIDKIQSAVARIRENCAVAM